jgi:SpoIID/LytB domain protein
MIKIHDVPYGVGFSWEGREDRLYRGKIEVNLNKKGRICVINEIELEEYLLGIVPSEVSSQAPIEILKAQCIAARGEAVAKIGKRHLADPYDFCSLQHCQVYSGIKLESPSTNKAVKETVGKILVDKFGIIDTVYSANCGGHTECNENVWASRKNPALRGVPDFNPEEFKSPITEREIEQWLTSPPEAYCSKAKNFRWEVTYTQDELNQLVNKWREVGEVRDIILRDRGVSGRLKSIKIIGTDDTYTIYKELPIRKVLGNLPSAMFILRIDRDEEGFPIQFRFIGGGWGHGVGMCQAGAVGMAKIGKTYNEILTHYYSGSKIIKLY